MAEFSAKPRNRPLFGMESVSPFTTHVQAAGGGTQNVSGEVVGKPLIPSWLVVAVLVALVACVCLSVAGIGLGGILGQATPGAPEATAPASEEQPAEPPPEQPAEPPPEQPAEPPPEQPAEPPPEEPAGEQPPEEPPAAEQPPAESSGGSLACVPLAGGLVFAPLLVIGKKGRGRHNENR